MSITDHENFVRMYTYAEAERAVRYALRDMQKIEQQQPVGGASADDFAEALAGLHRVVNHLDRVNKRDMYIEERP
jgi:hypothetical protein